MTDQDLDVALANLGLAPSDHHAVLLLPLIQVAWADNDMHIKEKAAIQRFATELEISSDARNVVEGWLSNDPGVMTYARGQTILRELARRQTLPLSAMDRLVDQAEQVARAAGGLLGMFTVDRREKEVLQDISGNLSGSAIDFTSGSWDDVLELA